MKMAIPLLQNGTRLARYIAGRKLRGDKRYPLVLMLEPPVPCNLGVLRCGKSTLSEGDPAKEGQRRTTPAQRSTNCGAPIVSIPGGNPLIHKELPQNRVRHRWRAGKFVYLCTTRFSPKHIDE